MYVVIAILNLWIASVFSDTLDCTGHRRYTSEGTGYYPTNGGIYDRLGHPLHSLEDFLNGRSQWVSVAMDSHLGILYGKSICIPELNHKYNTVIPFKVVDSLSSLNAEGYGKVAICSQAGSIDSTVNGPLTVVFRF